ncbi:MAG TPA: TIGR02587 family membrane protein, partial [Planctomycetaceae bacterium]
LRESVEEYGRGIIGGLLFSLPMLYTMEVWWHGFIASPQRLLCFIAVTFVLLLAYNRYAGMRRDAAWWEVAVDSVEELGIALLLSPLVLFLLGRIGPETSWPDLLGKTVIEAMIVAVGVSIGTAQLGGGEGEAAGMDGDGEDDRPHPWGQTVVAFCGATVFAANVAPTEEILMIGLEASPARLLGLAAFSVLVGAVTFFFSGFVGSDRYVFREGPFHVAFGIVTCYAAALASSAMMLWFFGRFEGAPPPVIVAQTVALGLPAMLGASAGRLLIQGGGGD